MTIPPDPPQRSRSDNTVVADQLRRLGVAQLDRLRHYRFAPRRTVEGTYAGRHASVQRGQSVEFRDYRAYTPGDSLRHVDWKAYGRSDRMYVRHFEHQTQLTVSLLVDSSASMAYRGMVDDGNTKNNDKGEGNGGSKFDTAARLAATIALVVTRQQDRVAFGLAQGGLKHLLRPAQTEAQLAAVLNQLDVAKQTGQAQLADALGAMATISAKRGVLIVISDLLDDFDAIERSLSRFDHRGVEVIIFHVLHRDELELPDVDGGVFIDSETNERLIVNVRDVRQSYAQAMRQHLDRWQRGCQLGGIDYQRVATTDHVLSVLKRYLFSRADGM